MVNSIHEENMLRKQILILQAENEMLKSRINEYRRSVLLEVKARDDLGMIRRGEKVYLIPKK